MLSRQVVALAALAVTALVMRLDAQASSLEDSIRALESQRAQALLKADTVALSQLVADDFVEISRLGMLRTKADNTGTFRGFPFSGKIRYTRVFVRHDRRWRAVAMQQTSMQ